MITLVNEKFFHVESNKVLDNKNQDDIPLFKTQIMTYDKILKQSDVDANDSDASESLEYCNPRTIMSVFTHTEDYNSCKLVIPINYKPTRNIDVTTQKPEKPDTPIYIIAFPYNGFLRPLPSSPQYRIYQGMVCKSARYNIKLDTHKYNRILYMVVVPNVSLFTPDHKYHVDEISIELASYKSVYEGLDTVGFDMNSMTFTLHSDMTYETVWNQERLEEDAVDVNKIKETNLFDIYRPAPKKQISNRSNSTSEQRHKKPYVGNGNSSKTSSTTGYGDKKKYEKDNYSSSGKQNKKSNYNKKPSTSNKSSYSTDNYNDNSDIHIGTSLEDMMKKAFSDCGSKDLKRKQYSGNKSRR